MGRQITDVGGNSGDESLAVRSRQQLRHVPGVLGAAGEQLERDEVRACTVGTLEPPTTAGSARSSMRTCHR